MKKRKYTKKNVDVKKEVNKTEEKEPNNCISMPVSVSGKTTNSTVNNLDVVFTLNFETDTLDIRDSSGSFNIHMPEVTNENIHRVYVLLDMMKASLDDAVAAKNAWARVNPENEIIKMMKNIANSL